MSKVQRFRVIRFWILDFGLRIYGFAPLSLICDPFIIDACGNHAKSFLTVAEI